LLPSLDDLLHFVLIDPVVVAMSSEMLTELSYRVIQNPQEQKHSGMYSPSPSCIPGFWLSPPRGHNPWPGIPDAEIPDGWIAPIWSSSHSSRDLCLIEELQRIFMERRVEQDLRMRELRGLSTVFAPECLLCYREL
jgi:hypothetical protein